MNLVTQPLIDNIGNFLPLCLQKNLYAQKIIKVKKVLNSKFPFWEKSKMEEGDRENNDVSSSPREATHFTWIKNVSKDHLVTVFNVQILCLGNGD